MRHATGCVLEPLHRRALEQGGRQGVRSRDAHVVVCQPGGHTRPRPPRYMVSTVAGARTQRRIEGRARGVRLAAAIHSFGSLHGTSALPALRHARASPSLFEAAFVLHSAVRPSVPSRSVRFWPCLCRSVGLYLPSRQHRPTSRPHSNRRFVPASRRPVPPRSAPVPHSLFGRAPARLRLT